MHSWFPSASSHDTLLPAKCYSSMFGESLGKKLPETVDGDDSEKNTFAKKSTNIYVAEVRTHNGPPKKEGFKLVSKMKFWKVILNIAHLRKKDLLQVIQHGHFFPWQACPPWPPPEPLHQLGPSMVVRAGYQKTVGQWRLRTQGMGRWVQPPRIAPRDSGLGFGWGDGAVKNLYRILKNGKLIHVCINASDLESERERFEEFSVFNGLVIWYFYVGKSVQSVSPPDLFLRPWSFLDLTAPIRWDVELEYLLLAVICFKDRPRGRRFSLTWWETCFVTVELMRLD